MNFSYSVCWYVLSILTQYICKWQCDVFYFKTIPKINEIYYIKSNFHNWYLENCIASGWCLDIVYILPRTYLRVDSTDCLQTTQFLMFCNAPKSDCSHKRWNTFVAQNRKTTVQSTSHVRHLIALPCIIRISYFTVEEFKHSYNST